jgi:hypothetical protein
MDLRHRLPGSRSLFAGCAAVVMVTFCGCADMLPSDETWEKWSPSNIWYRMQPNQLGRLNEGDGIPTDVYYSISDYPERNSASVAANRLSNDAATVIKPIDCATELPRP